MLSNHLVLQISLLVSALPISGALAQSARTFEEAPLDPWDDVTPAPSDFGFDDDIPGEPDAPCPEGVSCSVFGWEDMPRDLRPGRSPEAPGNLGFDEEIDPGDSQEIDEDFLSRSSFDEPYTGTGDPWVPDTTPTGQGTDDVAPPCQETGGASCHDW